MEERRTYGTTHGDQRASEVLYIAAKAPRPGVAKTRLAAVLGHDHALALYTAFLCDLAIRFAPAPFATGWYITPSDAWADLAPLVDVTGRPPLVLEQPEGDWTDRQRWLFQGARARGEHRTVLIASDSPQITIDVVAQAFAALHHHDLVFGPVLDGGYYLIGMRGWHDVLHGVQMSTTTVLEDILGRAERIGLTIAHLAPTFDVDEIGDLRRLEEIATERDDLRATRAALAAVASAAAHRLGALENLRQ